MRGKSVGEMGKLLQTAFLISLLIHCLQGEETVEANCGSSNESDCVIGAVFGNLETNEAVDVLVKCAHLDKLSGNQFTSTDKIVWNGCNTSRNLKGLGLQKIPRKNQVKYLQIERFTIGALEAGTFDGFLGLEALSLQRNSIQNLYASCFRGLRNLKVLQMMENNLKWMESGLVGDLPKLNQLHIHDSERLLMANHQFAENQIVDDVVLEISSVEADLMEQLFHHVRNLSIYVKFNQDPYSYQTQLNGYEKDWVIENLKLENFRSGFIMENVQSIKSLQLIRAFQLPYSEFKLKDLPNLEAISLHQNVFKDFSSSKFAGNFNNLQVFDLSNNSMTEIDMRTFEAFANLREINLTGNFLTKLDEFNPGMFLNVQVVVDGNSFDCSWVSTVVSYSSLVYRKNHTTFNFDGFPCTFNQIDSELEESLCSTNETSDADKQFELGMLKKENFILKPETFMIIVSASCLLGMAVTFISIYIYRRCQTSPEPFYHLLRDSLFQPISDVRSMLRGDMKEIISRATAPLPPTNYEHPISDSYVTEMTDVAANIYEEIPPRLD